MILPVLEIIGDYAHLDITLVDGQLQIERRRTLTYYTLIFNNDGTYRTAACNT